MRYNNTTLSTINSGKLHNKFPNYGPEIVPKKEQFPDSVKDTISTGFEEDIEYEQSIECDPKEQQFIESSEDIISTESTEEIKLSIKCIPKKEQSLESVKNTISTGFAKNDQLGLECKKPTIVTYLIKDNYLSEFEKETEKQLARYNLGVYSKQEVEQLTKNLQNTINKLYVSRETMETRLQETIQEINNIIKSKEYVDSKLKSRVNYSIPEALFIL